MKTLRLRIQGRVQGVWFRESMRIEAGRLNLTGWVRNTSDGAFEALIQGSEADVDALAEWARRGPPQARVDRIEIVPVATNGLFSGFEKRIE